MRIDYAQCWEDPRVLRRALALGPGDRVLSVASGGDNSLALLLDDPLSVTAIDRNPAQVHLVALKVAAMRVLEYDEFIAFMGAVPCKHRLSMFREVVPLLSADDKAFWGQRLPLIQRGVLHAGRYERYLSWVRRALRLAVSPRTVAAWSNASTLAEQARVYREHWDGLRWRVAFSLLVNRAMLARWARTHGAFSQVRTDDIGGVLRTRLERTLVSLPARDQFILGYLLTGRYQLPQAGPSYLLPDDFQTIRTRLDRLTWVTSDLRVHLQTVPGGTYSAFNLSDVPEYLNSRQLGDLSWALRRASTPDARIAHWTLFTTPGLPGWQTRSTALPADPRAPSPDERAADDRGVFYGSFLLWERTDCKSPVRPASRRVKKV